MDNVYLLTKNEGKIIAAQSVFSEYGIPLKILEKDYPEIQAGSSTEIASQMALQAAKETQAPVIREDHSLCLNALHGMPGPFVSWFDKNLPVKKLLSLMKSEKDRRGYFELAAAYAKPNGEVKTYKYRVPIKISDKPKGNRGNWNKAIILIDNPKKTLAESEEGENNGLWTKNYKKIAEDISKEKPSKKGMRI